MACGIGDIARRFFPPTLRQSSHSESFSPQSSTVIHRHPPMPAMNHKYSHSSRPLVVQISLFTFHFTPSMAEDIESEERRPIGRPNTIPHTVRTGRKSDSSSVAFKENQVTGVVCFQYREGCSRAREAIGVVARLGDADVFFEALATWNDQFSKLATNSSSPRIGAWHRR